MAKISGGISRGHVSPRHNMRSDKHQIPENISTKLSKDNHTFIDKLNRGKTKINDWINERMKEPWERFLNSGTRLANKLKKSGAKYMDWHKEKSKAKSTVMEFVVQIGEHYQTKYNPETEKNEPVLDDKGNPIESLGAIYYRLDDAGKKEMREKVFEPYFKTVLHHIEEKYPHLEIVQAVAHYDEPNGTPHMHLEIVPIADKGYKIGPGVQVSTKRALILDGIPEIKSRAQAKEEGYQLAAFYKDLNDQTKEYLKNNEQIKVYIGEYEIKETVHGRKHEASDKYRSVADSIKEATAQAQAELNNIVETGQKVIDQKKQKIEELNDAIKKKEGLDHYYDFNLKIKESKLSKKQEKIDSLDQEIILKEVRTKQLDDALLSLQKTQKTKDKLEAEIKALEADKAEKTEEIEEKKETLEALNDRLTSKKSEVRQYIHKNVRMKFADFSEKKLRQLEKEALESYGLDATREDDGGFER